jgi:hypothetical protein
MDTRLDVVHGQRAEVARDVIIHTQLSRRKSRASCASPGWPRTGSYRRCRCKSWAVGCAVCGR